MGVAEDSLDRSIVRARRRLIPFLLFMYVVSFLDRANIGFAKLALQQSAGISEAAYALGAGLFFVSYALLEIPSNLILHTVGAKAWMSRIMVTWGLASAATMFATGPVSFCLLRLLLGAAEAGFFPGVILYLTYWFPNNKRGQILGLFYLGAPLAFILGGPLSGSLLQLHGVGRLQGWQWMFLVEGLMSVVGGILTYWYLDDKPENARWMPASEKSDLMQQLHKEDLERRAHGPSVFLTAFADVHVLLFAAIYFLIQMSVYGVVFYLPSEIASVLGRSVGIVVGLVSAIPWICALIMVLWLPRIAVRFKSNRIVASFTLVVAAVASAIFPASSPGIALVAACVAVAGFLSVQPLFWTFPTSYLAGTAAAGGLAMINAIGAMGGFVAPNIKIWADVHFGSQTAGQYVLAGTTLCAALLIALVDRGRPPYQIKSSNN
jgi:MFS family permease